MSLRVGEPVQLCAIRVAGQDRSSLTAGIRDCAQGINVLVDLLDEAYVAFGAASEISHFLRQVEGRRDSWSVGGVVSSPFADPSEASHHLGGLTEALHVLRQMGRLSRIVAQSDVNIFAKLLHSGNAAQMTRHLTGILEPIHTRSGQKAGELKRTLLCFSITGSTSNVRRRISIFTSILSVSASTG